VVAGQLLVERELVEVRSYEDPWDEWVSRFSITRPDGLWLADGTGKYPIFSRHELLSAGKKEKGPTSEQHVLLSLAGFGGDLSIGERLLVSGSWTSPDGVDVSVMSALVPGRSAALAARALASGSDFHMWLPSYRYDDEDDSFDESEYEPMEAWIANREASQRLDQYDPLGSRAALARPRPAKQIRTLFDLKSDDAWSSIWMAPRNVPAFNSDAWGVRTGEGRSESWQNGTALHANRAFLKSLLTNCERSLLLLIKLQHYQERGRFADIESGEGGFTYSWLIATVSKRFNVELFELNKVDLDLVYSLPEHARFSFQERYRVISEK
jgi:hypothetical protein